MKRCKIESPPAELGGGVRLKLFEDKGVEAGSGVFLASPDEAESAYAEATAEGEAWLAL